MSLGTADGYIAGFKIRYVYDFWRPVTAIREGDIDGNDATAGDPSWNSLQNTPAVSDYPSTQSTFSGAVPGFGGGLRQLLSLPMCRESMAQTQIVERREKPYVWTSSRDGAKVFTPQL